MLNRSSGPKRTFRLPPRLLERLPPSLLLLARDRYLWAMVIVALLLNVGLVAFLIIQFNLLPPLVPLHFDPRGEPDRIEPRETIFLLPQIGLIIIAGNFAFGAAVYRREPLISYMLAGTAILLQFLLWFAAILIVRAVSV